MKCSVYKAETLGFCMGVRRAIRIVEGLTTGDYPKPVQTLGPLIHNRLVLEKLEKQGVRSINSPEECKEGTVVLRAHGVTPKTVKELETRGCTIIDGTCPRVLKSHRIVAEYASKGWMVLLIGDPEHGEIQGIAGHAGEDYTVVQNKEEGNRVCLSRKTLILGQTTLKKKTYESICNSIRQGNPQVLIEVGNTICPATEERQKSLLNLLEKVDAVLIIGGKNSANTRRLFNTAREKLEAVWHIEEASEIPEEVFSCSRIGVTAGASTPDWIIDEVMEQLNSTNPD